MDRSELCFLSAAELAPLIRKHTVSPVDIVQAHLARIEALNDSLRAPIKPGPILSASPTSPPSTGGVDAQWVMDFARLTGLSFVAESDAEPIAASIAPVKAMLSEARARLAAGIEPPVRAAPA